MLLLLFGPARLAPADPDGGVCSEKRSAPIATFLQIGMAIIIGA